MTSNSISKRENCTTQVKNVMLSALKISEDLVNSMQFCSVHRLNKVVEGPDRSLRISLIEKIETWFGNKDKT